MISKSELLEDIEKLEKLLPTPQTCSKLADLYILYDHLYKIDNILNSEYSFSAEPKQIKVDSETDIILPTYSVYIESKRNYQQGDIPKEKVLKNLEILSDELKDFVKRIYRNSDMPEERAILNRTINDINVGNI